MSDLTDFLLARIAEDEEVAHAAVEDFDGRDQWIARDNGDVLPGPQSQVGRFGEVAIGPDYSDGIGRAGTHIARHDPARVLAECAARRRIVELYREWDTADGNLNGPEFWAAPVDDILRTLALPYADHELYREEWKP